MVKEELDRGASFSPPSVPTHQQTDPAVPPSWLGMTQGS